MSSQLERIATVETGLAQNKEFITEIREKLHAILNIVAHKEETSALRDRMERLQEQQEKNNLRLTVLENEKEQEQKHKEEYKKDRADLRTTRWAIVGIIVSVIITIITSIIVAAHWVDTVNANLENNSKVQQLTLAEVQDLKQHER